AGAIAGLEAWGKRDHAAVRTRESGYLKLWMHRLAKVPGLKPSIVRDTTGNPLDRLRLEVSAESGTTAWALAAALGRAEPPIIVRDDEIEYGHFFLDPCNLHPGEAEVVADQIAAIASGIRGKPSPDLADLRRRHYEALMAWPDRLP